MAGDSDDSGYDKPVEEGKTYVLTVEDLGSKGDGIARVEGFVVFVPETEVGETVEAEITSIGSKFAFAEVTDRDVDADEAINQPEEDEEPDEDVGDAPEDVEERADDVEEERYDRDEVDEDDFELDDEVEDDLDEEDIVEDNAALLDDEGL